MPASGRLDAHPPPLHSELTVGDLSAVGDEVWAVGRAGAPGPALIAHTSGGGPWQLVSYSSSSKAEHTQLSGVHATASATCGPSAMRASCSQTPNVRTSPTATGRRGGRWRVRISATAAT